MHSQWFGVIGGSNGAIYRHWQIGADYDNNVGMPQLFIYWSKLKELKKLCNNGLVPARDEEKYDQIYKYEHIFISIVSIINYLTKYAKLVDQIFDETSFATASLR